MQVSLLHWEYDWITRLIATDKLKSEKFKILRPVNEQIRSQLSDDNASKILVCGGPSDRMMLMVSIASIKLVRLNKLTDCHTIKPSVLAKQSFRDFVNQFKFVYKPYKVLDDSEIAIIELE